MSGVGRIECISLRQTSDFRRKSCLDSRLRNYAIVLATHLSIGDLYHEYRKRRFI